MAVHSVSISSFFFPLDLRHPNESVRERSRPASGRGHDRHLSYQLAYGLDHLHHHHYSFTTARSREIDEKATGRPWAGRSRFVSPTDLGGTNAALWSPHGLLTQAV